MKIDLHIEQLVVYGVSADQGRRIGTVVEREIGRLLVERGAPEAWRRGGERTHVTVPEVRMMPGASAEEIGREWARSIYGGLATAGRSTAGPPPAPTPSNTRMSDPPPTPRTAPDNSEPRSS